MKHFEGCYLKAYRCPAGVWTIGFGHTGLQHKDGTVYDGRMISQAQAEELFRYDMHQFEERVTSLLPGQIMADCRWAAVISFDFNTGAFHRSTLRKKITAGDYEGAANEFLKWTRGGGWVLPGLVRRRKAERAMFVGGDWQVAARAAIV